MAFITMTNEKMAKSKGNILSIKDVKGFRRWSSFEISVNECALQTTIRLE